MKNYPTNIPIKQWAEDDQPREKLIALGKSALSDSELIAILIRSGSRQQSAVDLAKTILSKAQNNLIELSRLSLADFVKIKGVGEAKALSVVAALELGKRRRGAEVLERRKITCSRDVFEFMQVDLAELLHEEFWVIFLTRANHIIRKIAVSEGGLSGTVADPKRIFKAALDQNASSLILCHNHPSGQVKPSEADIKLTKKIQEAGLFLDIPVLDHVIAGDECFFSFADEGLI
jgi:DNA repair protein RadC